MNTREQEKTTPCHYKPRHFDKAAVRMHQIIGDDKKGILSRVLFLLGPLVALFQVRHRFLSFLAHLRPQKASGGGGLLLL